jgi:ankyrin repeat protein
LKGIVVSLLDAGADPRLLDKKGWSARKYAELTGNLDIAAMLESAESGVSTKAHEYL